MELVLQQQQLGDELQETLQAVIRSSANVLGGTAGVLIVFEHTAHSEPLVLGWNLSQHYLSHLAPWLGQLTPLLLSIHNSDVLLATELPIGLMRVPLSGQIELRQLVVLPLKVSGLVLGAIHVLRPFGARSLLERDRALLKAHAEQAGIAVFKTIQAQELLVEKERMEAIIHNSGDGIYTVDALLRITGFNPSMERLTGWKQDEVRGQNYCKVLKIANRHAELLCGPDCAMLRAFASGEPVLESDITLTTKDRQRIAVAIIYAAIRSNTGEPLSGVANVRDITRTRESEELHSTFISVISHELQTPIAIIKGYAGTLSRADAKWTKATLRERLHAIEEEADRLSKLVANLLYASRIQAGGLKMERVPLALPELVQQVVRRMEARSDGQYRFRLHFPPNFPLVKADSQLIEEVLTNLVENALKYSPKNKDIRIEGQVTGEDVIISVSDRGVGIPLREQERIFERFQRVDNRLARQTQGAGLGLYICRAIIEAHAGKIWVDSELDHGSQFSFSIPREEKAQLPMVVFGKS